MVERSSGSLRYMAAIAFLMDLLDRQLIDADDYCAIETKYAAKYLPLFRYEKPCKKATLPITQTETGGEVLN